MKRLIALFAVLAAFAGAAAATAAPVDTGHVVIDLLPSQAAATPGGKMHIALSQKIDAGWHTYWRNPGDSGEATKIGWSLPPGWTAGDILWPAPSRLPAGPLINYGFSNEVLLPVEIAVPADARPGQTVKITAQVDLLVCEEICIPESGKLELSLPVAAGPPDPSPYGVRIARAISALPKPAGLDAAMGYANGGLKLAVAGEALAGADFKGAYFFPYDGAAIEHAKPQTIEAGPKGLTLTLVPGVAFQNAEKPTSLSGVLSVGERAYEITATTKPAPDGAAGLGMVSGGGIGAGAGAGGAAGSTGPGLGLPLALLFAFLGGVILNLMPCVFPVLSMKAAALAAHGESPAAARRQGLAYGAGVMATFLVLAGLLIAAKAAGAQIGWGFQLQSPGVVAALALLMLLIALNMSGVFEAKVPGANLAGPAKGGVAGSFLTGLLAVIVASPCTAPFMAAALGFALTQSAAMALSVFAALGLGFALPFVALSMSPGLLARIGRPGPWMEGLRKLLAFPMYGAAAWLAWVLTAQAGSTALALLLAAGVVTALAAWLWGAAQRREAAGARPLIPGAFAAGAALLAVGLTVAAARTPAEISGPSSNATAALKAETWSPARLAELRAEGKPVLVNFTAAWCVTCQVNERTSLSRKAVADAFARTGVVYMKADWTRKDAVIAQALAEQGRAGVPLYLVYGADPAIPPKILPQLLTEKIVIAALEEAALKT